MPVRTTLMLLALASAATAQVPTLSSTFDAGVEGWEVIGYDEYSHTLPGPGSVPTWSPAGNPGGCLEVFDEYYLTGVSAPPAWLGDKRAYAGGTISYDFYEWETTSSWVLPGVVLVSTDHSLFHPESTPTPSTWVSHAYVLTAGAWRLDAVDGPVASQAQLLEALADLQAILLPTEWRSGLDDTFIDNVVLAPPLHGSLTLLGSGLNPPGSMQHVAGAPRLGTTLTLGLGNPLGSMTAGSPTFLALSLSPLPTFPAGLPLPGFGMAGGGAPGELFVDVTPSSLALPVLAGPPLPGAGLLATYPLPVPSAPAFAGLVVYAQGLLVDPLPTPWMGLTDAAMIVLGV